MSEVGEPGSSYTVLRIKRKATEPPLSSLVIQSAIIDPRRKRRKDELVKSRGIFRLADTVPDTWQGQGSEGDVLRRRIKGLLESRQTNTSPQSPHPPQPLTPQTRPVGEPSKPRQVPNVPRTQYRIVPRAAQQEAGMPPRVLSNAELNAAALKLVDAEAVASSSQSNKAASEPNTSNPDEEEEMAAFLPMLQEYLKLEGKSALDNPPSEPEAEQYVYDLYYRDIRSSQSSTPLNLGQGDGVHIGALLGYQDDDGDSDVSDSEPEDEADEDSNDEDYYRNDYPEDEDGDEDMHGYKDAFGEDEDEESASDPESEGGRGHGGLWSYR
ncbi:hypothetical protein BD324DRAFT_428915 [Kockovaella imperatae]|uniref:Probable RNA polymerase II nuclear localization protein SLC7A6OS n=1 Tax=Kockovaella imperatae TaxID=4999 RepID=A0A1Y1UGK1_9TREE|nr:hypothetical protein BD324DRAFT_428915 [Kockovaella imperatae]ORX37152.1 hypothetical protein BD324DRAFT_428915 [Kockovaella imperatae]